MTHTSTNQRHEHTHNHTPCLVFLVSNTHRLKKIHARIEGTDQKGLEDLRRFLESFWDEQLRILKHGAETEEGRTDYLGPSPT